MTATRQPRNPLRWAIRVLQFLQCQNEQLIVSGEAIIRSARAPQPRPQADPAEGTPAQAASTGKVLTGV